MSANPVSALRARPVFESPALIVVAAALAALMVGALVSNDIQLGIALMLGFLYLPLALLNLPWALTLWVPVVFLESWSGSRFIPYGVAILLGLAWLGTIGDRRGLPATVLRRHRGTFGLALAFCGWLTLSAAWATSPSETADDVWYYYLSVSILVVVSTTMATRKHVVAMCGAFVIGALITVILAVSQSTLSATAEDAARLGGSVQDPNYLAAGLLAASIVALGLWSVADRLRTRWALIAAILVLGIGFLATGSRGGLVAAGFALGAGLIIFRGGRLRLLSAIGTAILIATATLALASPTTLERVRAFDTTGAGRVDLWRVAGRMTNDHPVIGVGLGNFPVKSADYVASPGQLFDVYQIVETPKVVHNAYLEFLVETGVIGCALFVALVFALLRISWQASAALDRAGDQRMATLARAVWVAQVAALAALLFLSNADNHPLWILLALGPAMVTIARTTKAGEPA